MLSILREGNRDAGGTIRGAVHQDEDAEVGVAANRRKELEGVSAQAFVAPVLRRRELTEVPTWHSSLRDEPKDRGGIGPDVDIHALERVYLVFCHWLKPAPVRGGMASN
jgi:hypothetical protein